MAAKTIAGQYDPESTLPVARAAFNSVMFHRFVPTEALA
jgi:hypothetical protein